MATVIRKVEPSSGGKEGLLTGLGIFFLIIGILGAVAQVIAAVGTENPAWLLPALASFLWGLVVFAVLSAVGEIIRLLKKLNGLPYGGKISEPNAVYSTHCSICNSKLGGEPDYARAAYPSEDDLGQEEVLDKCPHCGEAFDKDDNGKTIIQPEE